ncbi:MAG: AhpC/TSA family protein [Sphingobacteriales bacterium]|nr:AhpC/TSA family protein [Sphingobacteriales bacterium]
MRLLLFSILLSLTCTKLLSQRLLPFSIKGKFSTDTTGGKMYLYYQINGVEHADSCLLKKGVFSFSGSLIHTEFARLSFNNRVKDFFLEPKPMTILFKDAELKQIETSGSKSELEFREIDNQLRKINIRWKTVFDTLDAVSLRSNAAFQELRDWVLLPYFEECRETYLDFFNKNPQSFITAYYLSQNVIEMNQGVFPTDSLQAYYDRVRTPIKNSWYGKKIMQELANRKVAIPGTEAFSFMQTDINGLQLSLSSFRGKYILLDFWGSWCVPCRKGNPHLKELYYHYKDKGFDIIGIAKDDNTKDAWIKAVEKDGLPWHQILCNNLDIKYNVTSYPTKILIDKQGLIIGRFGEDEIEIDKLLNSIFDKTH